MRSFTLIMVMLVAYNHCFAQKTVEELAELPAKKFFRDVYYDTSLGNNLVKLLNKRRIKFADLPDLKKVGLLSIYIKDESFRKGRKGGVIYNHDKEENLLSAGVLDASLNSVKQILTKLDIQLMSSDEYLTDEDKKREYNNFVFNYSSITEAKKFSDFFVRNNESFASPADYRMIYSTFEGGTAKEITNSLGNLSAKLGLDALLTIEIQTRTTNKSVILESITVVMHGTHPTLKDEGLFFGIGKYSPSSQVPFAEIVDEDIKRARFEGFETIMTRLVSGLAEVAIGEIESIE